MASEFTGFKSCSLLFLKYHAREGVPDTHRLANIDELKHRLVQVWAELDHRHIAAAIGQRRRCLNAYDSCVKAQGGYFDQHLH